MQIVRKGDQYELTDLGSTNGTLMNGQRIRQMMVDANTPFSLGSYQTTVATLLGQAVAPAAHAPRPPGPRTDARAAVPATTGPAEQVVIGDGHHTIGREPDCDTVVNEGRVSGRHARVFRNAGRLILEDTGSRLGTFLQRGGTGTFEDKRWAVLEPGDVVRIGGRLLTFSHPSVGAQAGVGGARVDVDQLVVEVTHNVTGRPLRLVNEVSFSVMPGEVIGILGPSGSGKTTLLDVLAGKIRPSLGSVTVNGAPIYSPDGQLAPGMGGHIGHAPQFDVMHTRLKVHEALRFSAKLRAPSTWSDGDIETRVQKAL
ncbi:MAG: FHA domain-containing protein, partial [Myxococcota bacterium]|nr:FHA domain-containing protein [Myxococcota bacterium]